MSTPLVLRVLRASDRSAVAAGTSFAIHDAVVVGRSPEADVVIADPSVSRRHLEVDVGPPVVVRSLTSTNGTFLGGVALSPGSDHEVPPEGVELQLGGVLLALQPLAETEPVLVSLDPGPHLKASFEVVWDGGQCIVRCQGSDLGLTGTAARFFGLLAERPGEVVHHWDLQQDLGTPHLAPLATAVRRALADATEHGLLDIDWLRSRVKADELALADVLRRVVQSRRAHGYALHLRAEDLVITKV